MTCIEKAHLWALGTCVSFILGVGALFNPISALVALGILVTVGLLVVGTTSFFEWWFCKRG